MSDFAPMHGALPLIESPFCHLILAVLTILRSQMEGLQKNACIFATPIPVKTCLSTAGPQTA